MQWDEAQGIGSGVIRTNLHNQGSPKRSRWSKSEGDDEGLSRWDLALGTDHDNQSWCNMLMCSLQGRGVENQLVFEMSFTP